MQLPSTSAERCSCSVHSQSRKRLCVDLFLVFSTRVVLSPVSMDDCKQYVSLLCNSQGRLRMVFFNPPH